MAAVFEGRSFPSSVLDESHLDPIEALQPSTTETELPTEDAGSPQLGSAPQSRAATPYYDSRQPTPSSSGLGSPRNSDSINRPGDDGVIVEAPKARRIRTRTGCLTCRERHLKCDERLPRCQNCLKSDRVCRRGLRLNFIDIQTVAPPQNTAHSQGTQVAFQDESRFIASEYVGGFESYPPLKSESHSSVEDAASLGVHGQAMQSKHNASICLPIASSVSNASTSDSVDLVFGHQGPRQKFADLKVTHSSYHSARQGEMDSQIGSCLNDREEVFLMQVFIEEVGLWMDSMDEMKHFTQILPFYALDEPMLLKAFMACAARHLALVNPSYGEDKPVYYYEAASRDLLNCLQDPNRDSVLCATTAVILNVYEVMCARAMHRMNHIAGARALIKECHWDARSYGLGKACFWLNIGMELLSCLHFNWTLAWDPDTWGVDMNMQQKSTRFSGDEDLWTHRIVYICAKVANFRSSIPRFQRLDPATQELQLPQRCQEWNSYNSWCDEWANAIPRSMKPFGYLQTWQSSSNSAFPEVWIVHRSAIVGRLFYHTTRILLAKIHPLESQFSPEMRAMQQRHAHAICGIVAHCKDRGAASVSIRCLALAAECLVERHAQQEALEIFDKIIKETGWRVDFIKKELQETWGWTTPQHHYHQSPPTGTPGSILSENSALNSSAPISAPHKLPAGVVNPLMATADFSMANHPYQTHYVAPHHQLHY